MDFKRALVEIKDFLVPYGDIWNKEILIYYPEILKAYKQEYLDTLAPLELDDLWEIDARVNFKKIEGSNLHKLLQKTMSFNEIIKSHDYTLLDLPSVAFTRVKEKKHHELDNMVPLIDKLNNEKNFNNVVDIGGGVGHLSRVLGQYFDIPSTCIDYNPDFLARGQKTIDRQNHPKKENIQFLEMDVKETPTEDFSKKIERFDNDSFMVGLHSCGPLSVKLLKTAAYHNLRGILNFGCCYFKCAADADTLISKFAQENPLHATQEGLTLATRAHTYISKQDFLNKLQVKRYRYGLHLLLYKELGVTEFISVGDSNLKDYWKGFGLYAVTKLKGLNIEHKFSEEDLNKFYDSKLIQDEIKKMFLCNLIRWFFGRPIELYVLLDRAIYMQEQGYETSLTQYFKEDVSPRNIGLLALK